MMQLKMKKTKSQTKQFIKPTYIFEIYEKIRYISRKAICQMGWRENPTS